MNKQSPDPRHAKDPCSQTKQTLRGIGGAAVRCFDFSGSGPTQSHHDILCPATQWRADSSEASTSMRCALESRAWRAELMLTWFFLAAHLQQRCWSLAEPSKSLVVSSGPAGHVSTTRLRVSRTPAPSGKKSLYERLDIARSLPAARGGRVRGTLRCEGPSDWPSSLARPCPIFNFAKHRSQTL